MGENYILAANTVIVINRNGMGDAPQDLAHTLVTTYLGLLDGEWLPAAICLYASGVKLATSGSPALDALKALSDKGVLILLCTTCLKYFDLLDDVQVGVVGGMNDIIDMQHNAQKVITL